MIGRSEIVSGSKLTQNILEGIEIILSKISELRKVLKYSPDLAISNIRSILFCVFATWHRFLFELLCIENNQKLVIQEIEMYHLTKLQVGLPLKPFIFSLFLAKNSKKYPKIHLRYPKYTRNNE